jgi:DNA-binding MurR/RpiR family transcriptional regulator
MSWCFAQIRARDQGNFLILVNQLFPVWNFYTTFGIYEQITAAMSGEEHMAEEVIDTAPPTNVTELLNRLDDITERLPKRLKQCAAFTRRHLHLIAVSTVSEMARSCEVAPSVYMRFCQTLGFSGFTEMQALFRAQYTEFRPNYEERLASLHLTGQVQTGRLLADFAEAGHKSLLSLGNTVTSDCMDRIAQGMAEARVVHLVGLRRAYTVVSCLAYLLEKLRVPVMLHSGSGMLAQEGSILPGDVLFAVSYAPFSKETIEMSEAVSQRGITVYGLTDSDRFPIKSWAREVMIAREDEVAGFRSLNASITLVTALALAIKTKQEQC